MADATQFPPEWQAFVDAALQMEKDFQAERQTAMRLARELEELKSESREVHSSYDRLYQRFTRETKRLQELEIILEENTHVQRAREALEKEKHQFRQVASILHREVEYLRTVYPLRDLLMAKQAELERLKKGMNAIPQGHPDRKSAEALVRAAIAERDEVRRVAEEGERRIQAEMERIQRAMEAAAPSQSPTDEPL
ncbi:MAG: hypothetical protein ACXVCH_06585 [Bdellovibrionota bacterium]